MSLCIDSDGANYNSKGFVTLNESGKISKIDDSCSGNTIIEGVCKNNKYFVSEYNCTNGCNDGICNEVISSSSSSSSSGGSSGSSSSSSSSGSSGGSIKTTATGSSSTASTASNPSTSGGSFDSSSGTNSDSNNNDVECVRNSDCSSKLCMDGKCIASFEIEKTSKKDLAAIIQVICHAVNPFDERGYTSCVRSLNRLFNKN